MAYLLLILHLTPLLILIILIINLFAFKPFLKWIRNLSILPKNQITILALIFILGSLGQMLIIAPSGMLKAGDLFFWSSHGHDGTWHIALMEEIKKGSPFQNPILAGEKLVNYHFFSDIAPAMFNKYLNIPSLDLYFRFFPLFFSIILGALSYFLGKRIGGNFSAGIFTTIFTYFCGSFGYIVTFIRDQKIGGESFFWASQIQSSTGNPPLIVSFLIILTILILLKIFFEEKKLNKTIFFALILLSGSLIEFKSYAAIIILLSLGIVGIWQILKDRAIWTFALFLISCGFASILYFPNAKGSAQFLIFEPWWFIRTLIVAQDRLNWLDLELKRQTYIAEGNWKRVTQIEIEGFLMFLFGNLGMRFLGFWYFLKSIKSVLKDYFNLYLILICFISFLMPLLFLQKGVAGNTIQFLQYFLLIFGIFAGVSFSKLLRLIHANFIKLVLTTTVIVLAIPTQIGLIYDFYSRAPLATISSGEISALEYLKKHTPENSIVLTPAFNKYLNLNISTLPIWAWADTSYVAAFSSRRTFFSDMEQADIMGYNFKDKLNFQQSIFLEENPKNFEQKLKDNKIEYLYFPLLLNPRVDLTKTNLQKVFSNHQVEIWKV